MRGITTKKGTQNIGPAATMARASVRSWQGGTLPANALARPAGSRGRGVFVEEGTKNLFSAEEAAGTLPATKTLAAGTYAVSAYGGGSIDVTGAVATACAGPDGANCKVFTLAAQTDVTFAANGAVSKAQLEAKAYSTNWQNPALGARAEETLTLPTYIPATARELAEYAYGVNLLTANQASCGEDGTIGGLRSNNNAVIIASTEQVKAGSRSIKVITGGTAGLEGVKADPYISVMPSMRYAAGAWVYGVSGTVILRIVENDINDGFIGTSLTDTVPLNGTWQYLAVSRLFTAAGRRAVVRVETSPAQTITFYVDQLSLERIPTAESLPGSWVPGQQRRLVDATRGTITLDALINSTAQRRCGQYAIRITDKISLSHATDSSNWILSTKNDDGVATTATIADALIPVGWRKLGITYNSTSAKLYVDGTLVGTIDNPNLPSSFPSTIGVGCSADGTGQLGTAIDNVALYSDVVAGAVVGKAGVVPVAGANCVVRRTFDASQQVTRIGGRR